MPHDLALLFTAARAALQHEGRLTVEGLVGGLTGWMARIAQSLDYYPRLRPGTPLLGGGWLTIDHEEGERWLDANCTATSQSIDAIFDDAVSARDLLGASRGGRDAHGLPTDVDGGDAGLLVQPKLRMEQLVLAPEIVSDLSCIAAEVRDRGTLLDAWGLGRVIDYGRGSTVLFEGPPGVGKTATAQALAADLGRPLLVVDYTRLVSAWVGATDKAISKVFRKAKRHDAVLFWDEADAILASRSSAHANHEARTVNVLLRELEVFDDRGLCVLATNRKPVLDSALERRIRWRVHFSPPTAAERVRLWQRLLPAEMPLADEARRSTRLLRSFENVCAAPAPLRHACPVALRMRRTRVHHRLRDTRVSSSTSPTTPA